MTVKEPVATLDMRSGAGRPSRRGDAVGAEIPVTVHASRAAQGLGKNLPPVHEETRTVIVLEQGAVVRLTANLTTGETVVLTNRVTGADVLCRVGNVKSQPGIQHYVDLEFVQRAPGFWGRTVTTPSAGSPEQPETAPAPVDLKPVVVMKPATVSPAPSVSPPAPPASPFIPGPSPALSNLASPVANVQPPSPPLQPAPLAEPVDAPWNGPQTNAVAPIHVRAPIQLSADLAFGSSSIGSGHGSSMGSQKGLLVAAAAVLLVLGGALGGYWLTQHRGTAASSPAPQQAMNTPPSQATPDLPLPAAVVESAPVSLNTLSPQPQADIFVESAPPAEGAPSRVQPQPPTSTRARAVVPAVRRSNLTVGAIKAPVLKNTPVRADAAEPPPMMIGAANAMGDPGTATGLIDSAAAAPAPPVSSGPAIGGQLQPPQLISSAPPIYPPAARAQGLQGVVVLDAHVDETGKVVATDVVAGPAPLISAAQEAVRTWKYQPARLNGKPISINTRVSVRFNLH
jgi:protein TonB